MSFFKWRHWSKKNDWLERERDRQTDRQRKRERQRDASNRAFWGGKSQFGTERKRERERERYVKLDCLGWQEANLGQRERERESIWRWLREKTLGLLRLVFFISSCIFFNFFWYLGMVTGDGYGRWLREKTLGLLRSLGFLHFFL